MSDPGLYIYAFVDRACAVDDLEGIGREAVELVGERPPFALASPFAGERLRPDRRSLGAHQRVLAAISKRASVLPTTFGVVADSAGELLELIEANADEITDGLGRVSGCVEICVRVLLDVPDVFYHLVLIDDRLAALRDELARLGERAPHGLRVETGRRVEAVRGALCDEHTQETIAALEDAAREIVPGPGGAERDLCSLACLLEQDGVAAFDAAIESLAQALPDEVLISVGGPFAPHSFVNLNLAAQAA